MRARLVAALEEAARDKQQTRLATLRLITAAIRDRVAASDIDAEDTGETVLDDVEPAIVDLLLTMVAQREESIRDYEESGRLELAEREREEIAVIREFLPPQLSEAEISAAVGEAIDTVRAQSLRDIAKVMSELKGRYAGQMDFGAASAVVRRILCDRVRAEAAS